MRRRAERKKGRFRIRKDSKESAIEREKKEWKEEGEGAERRRWKG